MSKEAEDIAKRYTYGQINALTDSQEIKDLTEEIQAYAKHYAWNLLDMSNEELYDLVEDDNNSTQEDLDEKKGALKLRNHLIKLIEG